ncbi:hypothetical protein MKZ02_23540 [Pseudobacillus sp. FSL P4-0506]|uniref:hypothetical protein n=1 Tax=Pseudobacillus sp. FSL P4-0506 TaxID=2921576 RepID=UPI0030FA0CFA
MKSKKKVSLVLAIVVIILVSLLFLMKFKENVYIGNENLSRLNNAHKDEKNEGELRQKFAVLYSSPFQKGSEILVLNSKERENYFIKDSIGLGGIEVDDRKNFWLNGTESISLLSYNPSKDVLKDHKAKDMTNYFTFDNDIKIVVYKDKEDMFSSQLDVEYKEKKVIQQTVKGYIRVAESDGKYVYAFADLVDKGETSSLYVFDLASGKLIKQLNMKYKFANDIEFFRDNVIVGTKGRATVINSNNFGVSYLPPINEEYETSKLLKVSEERLLITSSSKSEDSGINILELDKDLQVKNEKNLKFPYVEAFVKNDKLYVIGPLDDGSGGSGIIGEFNINKDYKKTAQLEIPKPRNHDLWIAGVEILPENF